jgi:hypothetical protein
LQDTVTAIFKEAGAAVPRVHPVITLVYDEWRRAAATNRGPDYSAFSMAKIVNRCKSYAKEHPRWHADLSRQDLDTLLDDEDSDQWWFPGDQDDDGEYEEEEEEYEEDAIGAYSMHVISAANDFKYYRRVSESTLRAHLCECSASALRAHLQGCSACTLGDHLSRISS